ncbi:nicotinate dehydrogenase subunit A [Neolewinella xylanilytica]|uniref:Nicotinate dehydrogenase subunit A n=1 Tax=Neolewinella xylanilytica TaxID=1514080 RepID=A0A2S6IAJ6_9BACT|nr:(2Fe-2S)-binding protein [Neolewinella xylanilytica]PPK88479.1 nicotinate dehydrogenase subunit A [Neolewinella xylanilytica]
MSQPIRLRVNGQTHQAELEPEMPLLYFLRNDLALNGPKYGCGVRQCGACMVLLDGKAQPSCVIPVDQAQQHDIETLESFGTPDDPHPLQRAFVEEQAAQCGYCLNGAIVCAQALLAVNPAPSDTEIREALERVLCRCGTHSRIVRAVARAARTQNAD